MKDDGLRIIGSRVFLRYVTGKDCDELTNLFNRNRGFYKGRISPLTKEKLKPYYERNLSDANECFVICLKENDVIIGVINLTQIFLGPFQNAYVGFALDEAYIGSGFMTESARLAISDAFNRLGLHRLEANIQPDNLASIAVVKRCGFTKEGFSRKYLKIDEKWRDHERWAIISEDWN